MKKVGIVVHGGAGPDSEFARQHLKEYKAGIADAINAGYAILKKNGKALDAVEAAVMSLENNPFFNAGRGSSINAQGEVEMCAAIMDGKNKNSGAVAIVKNVRNPIVLAKSVMANTKHIYLGADGALNYAKKTNIILEPDAYFVTEHQFDKYDKKRKESSDSNRDIAIEEINERYHGTIGAVAVDFEGNVASGTSTGGTEYCKEGRIADTSMVGVGTYADNATCAISCTGDGEYMMRGVIGHSVASWIKFKKKSVKDACKAVLKENDVDGDIGMIAIDSNANFGIEFNSERMYRGWKIGSGKATVKIYRDK